MKRSAPSIVLIVFAICCLTAVSASASILGASAVSDTPSTLTLADTGVFNLAPPGSDASLDVTGSESAAPSVGLHDTVKTTMGDPTLRQENYISNNTGNTWNSYLVQLTLPLYFTISTPTAQNDASSGLDWTAARIDQPQLVGSNYVGDILFQAATPSAPVPDGGTFDFGYRVTFDGTDTSYQIGQVQTPNPVPEPGTLGLCLLGIAGLLLGKRLIRVK